MLGFDSVATDDPTRQIAKLSTPDTQEYHTNHQIQLTTRKAPLGDTKDARLYRLLGLRFRMDEREKTNEKDTRPSQMERTLNTRTDLNVACATAHARH